jgi:arylsulfatase
MDTPDQWTKQVASHWGGTRNGMIAHWPGGFEAAGELRSQFHHVIDLAPTVLEVAGLPEPVSVNGVQQMPLHGTSMAYTLDGPDEPDRHETQYFEMFGNRGVYHKGWTAVTRHKTPWILVGEQAPAFDDDRWELYDTTTDWSQARDLAKEHPDKLHELQRLWRIEAVRYGVLPLDDRVGERLNPDLAGRPTLIRGNSQLLFGGMGRLSESSVVNIKNKSHAVTAEVVVPASGAEGVIVAQGGSIGGWSLYAKDGRPRYCCNLLGGQRFYVGGDRAIPAGRHQVRMEFAYDGGGLGKGGEVRLFLDRGKVGEGRVAATAAMVFSADDTCDVGVEGGAVVSEDYGPRQRVHRRGQLGPDRPRRGRRGPRPPDHAGGAAPHRHGQAVAREPARPWRPPRATPSEPEPDRKGGARTDGSGPLGRRGRRGEALLPVSRSGGGRGCGRRPGRSRPSRRPRWRRSRR